MEPWLKRDNCLLSLQVAKCMTSRRMRCTTEELMTTQQRSRNRSSHSVSRIYFA